jgi:hypothetical protein
MPQDLNLLPGMQDRGPVDLNSLPGMMPAELHQGPENHTNWVEDFLHQATGGLSDKAEAALKASRLLKGGSRGNSFPDRYHQDLTNVRNDFEGYEAANPGWAGAKSAHAAGVIAPMAIVGPEAAAKTLTGAALKSGATGAALGAGYGFGSTNDESLAQDLIATGAGAAAGGVASTAMPVAMGIAKAPFRMAGRAASVFGEKGKVMAAGRVLNASKTNGNIFEPAPLPGMKLTTGQSTNDPGLLWLERNVSQATPEGATLSGKSLAENNKAIRGGIEQLGDHSSDAPKAMSDALDRVYAARRAENSAIWKKADVSNTGGVSGFQFNNFMKKYVGGLPVADQAQVPADVMGIMEKLGAAKTQNLSDVQSVRSMLSSRATQASRAGDGNLARILGNDGLAGQVENFIDMKAAQLGGKLPLYNEARAHTRELKQTFDQPPAIRAALGVDSHGADRVPVSATADHFINSGKGGPEKFNSYLKAITVKDPATGKTSFDPDGLKAAQDAFSQKFLAQVSNSGQDANGQNLVSPAKMQKFIDDYSHVINSPAFTPDQRGLVQRIAQATKMASRTANSRPPGGGSDTFQKLQGDKFIDALVGPGASKLVGVVGKVGGAATGFLEEGKMGALMGFMAGEKGASLVNDLYKAPRDKVVQIITEAMHDPQLAKDLMMKASNTNAKLLPPPRRAKIFGVIGAQAAPKAVSLVDQAMAPQ